MSSRYWERNTSFTISSASRCRGRPHHRRDLGLSDRSATLIAAQVGCTDRYVGLVRDQVRSSSTLDLPTRVTGKDGKTYASSRPDAVRQAAGQAAEVAQMTLDGASAVVIHKTLGLRPSVIECGG